MQCAKVFFENSILQLNEPPSPFKHTGLFTVAVDSRGALSHSFYTAQGGKNQTWHLRGVPNFEWQLQRQSPHKSKLLSQGCKRQGQTLHTRLEMHFALHIRLLHFLLRKLWNLAAPLPGILHLEAPSQEDSSEDASLPPPNVLFMLALEKITLHNKAGGRAWGQSAPPATAVPNKARFVA